MTSTVSIIGLGRFGKVFYRALCQNGVQVTSVVSKKDPKSLQLSPDSSQNTYVFKTIEEATIFGELVVLCVPDDEIRAVTHQLYDHLVHQQKAKSTGLPKFVVHVSGAKNSEDLAKLEDIGIMTGSLHVMQTFTESTNIDVFKNTSLSVEGADAVVDVLGELGAELGMTAEIISKEEKTARHLAGVFVSNFMSALVLSASEVISPYQNEAQPFILEKYASLMRTSLDNILKNGVPGATTGPAIRGDIETIQNHLNVLQNNKDLNTIYCLLSGKIVEAGLNTSDKKRLINDKSDGNSDQARELETSTKLSELLLMLKHKS